MQLFADRHSPEWLDRGAEWPYKVTKFVKGSKQLQRVTQGRLEASPAAQDNLRSISVLQTVAQGCLVSSRIQNRLFRRDFEQIAIHASALSFFQVAWSDRDLKNHV